jgi:hypothetical protein
LLFKKAGTDNGKLFNCISLLGGTLLWLGFDNFAGMGQAFRVANLARLGRNNISHWLCLDPRSIIPSHRPVLNLNYFSFEINATHRKIGKVSTLYRSRG